MLKSVAAGRDVWFDSETKEAIGTLVHEQGKEYLVVASATDKWGESKIENLRIILLIAWAVSVVIIVFLGYFFSSRALKPISEVVEQVELISETNLNARVRMVNNKDEIAHLAFTFNKMLARLEEAFMLSKSFVSNASHELRTPLTAITGQIEVILMQRRENEEYRQVLQSVLEDIKSLNKLSNGLLGLTQAGADRASLKMTSVRIDETLWQARTDVLKLQPDYQIDINFEALPENEEELCITGSENLLRTAFINLMENGCKFSDGRVEVLLSVLPDEISIKFTDKGIGIGERDIKNLTEPFFRADNARNVKGHGIGLSLTSKIVSLHRGRLVTESVLHSGTTFTVLLPNQPSTLAEA